MIYYWRATAHAADPKEKRLCECVATDRQLKGLLPIFRYPSQIRFECFVLMSCFDAACHLAQHLPVHSSLARVSFLGWGSQTRYKVARCQRKRTLKTSFVGHSILSLVQVPLWMSGRMLELFVSPCAIQLACASHFKLKSRSFNALH